MEIKEAQKETEKLIFTYGKYGEHLSMLARMTEEVGELARAMNIKYGGKKSKFKEDGKEIEKELADVLFTILALANSEKIDLDKEFLEKIKEDYEKMNGVYSK